jgi:hypothetical protein
MNFLTFMVGNPSAAETFLEKSSRNYVINKALFLGGGGYLML